MEAIAFYNLLLEVVYNHFAICYVAEEPWCYEGGNYE